MEQKIDQYENSDIDRIVTPIRAKSLEKLLIEADYDLNETQFLVEGFTQGFPIGYAGPTERRDFSRNIPITIGSKVEMWNKVMKEVKLKRFAGPYKNEPPFSHFIQSPIGLVPKAGGKTRLIFYLSYTFANGNKSVNYCTPKEICSVKYCDLDHAICNCLLLIASSLNPEAETISFAKTDLDSAFRNVPVRFLDHRWLCIMAVDPETGEKWYFIHLCLPFGASISCSHFQRISKALKHLAEWKSNRRNALTNYLDDFLFLALTQ